MIYSSILMLRRNPFFTPNARFRSEINRNQLVNWQRGQCQRAREDRGDYEPTAERGSRADLLSNTKPIWWSFGNPCKTWAKNKEPREHELAGFSVNWRTIVVRYRSIDSAGRTRTYNQPV